MGQVLAFPFVLLWAIIRFILNTTGRLIAVLLGLTFVIVGVALCLTVIGAILGIPLILLGVGLIVKGLFG